MNTRGTDSKIIEVGGGEAFSRKKERKDRYEENIIGRETECDKNMKRGRKYESVGGEDKHFEYERKDEKKIYFLPETSNL